MKAWKWLLLSALVCLMCFAVFTSCGDDDDDDDSDDDDSDDDDGDDDDDDGAANPIPPGECADFCTQENVNISNDCLADIPGYEQATVGTCIEQCQEGWIDRAIRTCFQNFFDCETLLECIGPYIE